MSENKIEFLCNVKTAMEAEQIVLLLEKNGIIASSRKGLMYIYGGNSAISDTEIFVSKEDFAKAKELIEQYQPIKPYAQKDSAARAYGIMPKAVTIGLLIIMIIFVLTGIVIFIGGLV